MPKYLMVASYTQEGLQGLLKEGGSSRRKAVAEAIQSLGGTLETLYYAFGDDDGVLIFDLPSNVAATAFSLIGNVSGAATSKIIVLITPEEVDQATEVANRMASAYRPRGQ